MRNPKLNESQARIKICGRNISNLRFADDTTLMAETKEELKNLLMSRKEERACLRLDIKKKKKTKIMASNPITSWQMEGEMVEVVTGLLFLGFKITGNSDSSLEIRWLLLGRKTMTNLDSVLKNGDITLSTKNLYSLGYGLPSGHVPLWDLYNKEGRTPKNWCLQTMMLEKTPESSLDSREIKPVNLKWNQPWIFTGRTDAETEAPVFWSSDVHRQLIGNVPDSGKDWGQKEKRVSQEEMVG